MQLACLSNTKIRWNQNFKTHSNGKRTIFDTLEREKDANNRLWYLGCEYECFFFILICFSSKFLQFNFWWKNSDEFLSIFKLNFFRQNNLNIEVNEHFAIYNNKTRKFPLLSKEKQVITKFTHCSNWIQFDFKCCFGHESPFTHSHQQNCETKGEIILSDEFLNFVYNSQSTHNQNTHIID